MLNKKGFTLVEMLVVIAIIAILVSIIVPTAMDSAGKAKAAADAANLRTIMGQANIALISGNIDDMKEAIKSYNLKSKLYPEAKIVLGYKAPAVYEIYFQEGSSYYDVEYFAEYAQKAIATPLTKSDLNGYEIIEINK